MSSPAQADEDEVEEEVEFVSVSRVHFTYLKKSIGSKDKIIECNCLLSVS